MGEYTRKDDKTDAIIAAFDRERDKAHEHERRLKELLRRSYQNDRPVRPDGEMHQH